MEIGKAELVTLLTDEENASLRNDARWDLRRRLTVFRFVAFTAFMLDIHDQLAILSKSFQSNALIVFDIPKNITRTIKALKKLVDTSGPGEHEQALLVELAKDEGANMFRTCAVFEREEGEPAFKKDRICIVRLSRFGPVMCDWIPPRLLLYYDFNRPSEEHSGSIT